MSYKIVRRAGVVIAWGPDTGNYQPQLAAGDALTVEPELPAEVLAAQTAAATRQAADDTDRGLVRADAQVRALMAMTPAQIDAWMTANVTNLAQARAVLTRLAQIVAVQLRRELL
ncbi:MAG TPA: hypothetical protein VF104_10415 [Burkholderiales bacterium]